MTLITSISGIRGTIGGRVGEALTPIDIVYFTAAFGTWIQAQNPSLNKIIIGRDARISGEMVANLIIGTLQGVGLHVIDLGLATTPTVEIAVSEEAAAGGIIITASHNPKQWNALKLLNNLGEFITENDGNEVLNIAKSKNFSFVDVENLGSYTKNDTYLQVHINKILNLDLVNVEAIKKANFKILIDGINSVGGIAIPTLLHALGVDEVVEFNCEPNGKFAHTPEPLPENLQSVCNEVKRYNCDVGLVVDPDADRLAIICENGEMFGEEYTLVAVADYVMQHHPKGSTVSNLSSTMALKVISEKKGWEYYSSAVGEVNVVAKMKAVQSVIGGEGNGGIILPELHYGRDALVGIALFLSYLALSGKSCSTLRTIYPNYYITKQKIDLTPTINIDNLLIKVKNKYSAQPINTEDGLKIFFNEGWLHLRKSNTEPIIRIYAESESETIANSMIRGIIEDIKIFSAE